MVKKMMKLAQHGLKNKIVERLLLRFALIRHAVVFLPATSPATFCAKLFPLWGLVQLNEFQHVVAKPVPADSKSQDSAPVAKLLEEQVGLVVETRFFCRECACMPVLAIQGVRVAIDKAKVFRPFVQQGPMNPEGPCDSACGMGFLQRVELLYKFEL